MSLFRSVGIVQSPSSAFSSHSELDISAHRRHIRTKLVTDPSVPGSINVTTMLAGVENLLVAPPDISDAYGLPQRMSSGSNRETVNLRSFHWKQDADAYRWFYGEYWDKLSHRMTTMLDPYDIPPRDYVVEFKIPLI